MALSTLSPISGGTSRRRIQPEVSEETARALRAVAALTNRQIGQIIDDLVTEHLGTLIDLKVVVASQQSQEEAHAAE